MFRNRGIGDTYATLLFEMQRKVERQDRKSPPNDIELQARTSSFPTPERGYDNAGQSPLAGDDSVKCIRSILTASTESLVSMKCNVNGSHLVGVDGYQMHSYEKGIKESLKKKKKKKRSPALHRQKQLSEIDVSSF